MAINAGSAMAYLDLDSSRFVTGMRNASRQMQEFDREGATTGDRMTALGNISMSVGSAMTKGLTLPLVGVGAASVKVATDFEAGMDKVQAVSGATGEDMKKLSDMAKEMGATTKFSATDAADALSFMGMAGWDTQSMMEGLPGILDLAAAGGTDLALTSDIVTDGLTGLGLTAADTGMFVDVMAATCAASNTSIELMGETLKYTGPVAGALGIDMQDLSLAIGLMGNAGIKGSQAGTALRSSLTNLVSPTDKMQACMDKYNIEVKKNEDGSVDLMATMENLRTNLGNLDETTQAAALSTIFGKEAMSGMAAIVNASEGDFNKLSNSINNSEGAAKSMADIMSDNLKGSIDNFKSALEGAGIVIGEILIPIIRDLVDNFTNALTWFNNLDEGTQELIVGFGATVAAIGPVLMIMGSLMKLVSTLTKVWGIATGAIATFSLAIPLAIAAIVGITSVIGSNTNALQFLQDKFGVVGFAIGAVCEHIYGVVQLTLGNVMIIIETIGKAIGAILKGQFWKVDDIVKEGWAKVENNTAKAMSNISGETSVALGAISEASEKELNQVVSTFDVVLAKLPTLTKHNIGGAAKEFTNSLQGMNDDGLTILRGTSDTMAIVLEGITSDMIGTEKGTKKMEANLESLAVSGGIDAATLEKEVSGAMKTINNNMMSEGDKLKQNASDVFNAFKTVSTSSVADMSSNVVANIQSMGEGTVAQLSGMGSTWSSILSGVKDDGSQTTAQMKDTIISNLSSMGITGEQLISMLRTESSAHMKGLEADVELSTANAKASVDANLAGAKDKGTQHLKELETNGSTSTKNLEANVTTNASKAGQSLDKETKKGGDAVKTNLSKASTDAQQEASKISKSVDSEMKNSTKSMQQEATNMYNGVKTSFSKMSQIAKQETTNMYKGVQTSFKAMESAAKGSATSMYKGVSTSFNNMANNAIADWNRIKSALRSPITGTVKIQVQGVQAALNQINSIKNQAKTNSLIPSESHGQQQLMARYTDGDLQRSLYSMMPKASTYQSNDLTISVRDDMNKDSKSKKEEAKPIEINLNIEKFVNERKQDVKELVEEIAFEVRRKNINLGGAR